MSDTLSNKNASGTDDSPGKGRTGQALEEFLQAPKKKRKSYIVMILGDGVDGETVSAIQKFIKTQYPKLSLITATSAEDALRYSSRNIVLAIIDDQFSSRKEALGLVRKLKELKTDGPMPALFLTKDAAALVEEYQRELLPWHEVDEYVQFEHVPRHEIFRKIKSGVETQFRRRAKRFRVDMPVFFQILDSGEIKYAGTLLDFSLHGALIATDSGTHSFSSRDQITVHLPLSKYCKGEADILRISARVRRVLISGNQAGLSWEYLTDDKIALMTKLLFAIVDSALLKSATATRAKINKNQPPIITEIP